QGRELVACQIDELLQLRDLLTGGRQCRLRLTQLEMRVDARLVAILGELVDRFALLQGSLCYIELQVCPLQLYVGVRNVRRQGKTGGASIQLSRTCLTERSLVCGAVLAPEINFPAQRRLQLTEGIPAAAVGRGNQRALGKTLTRRTRLRV